MYKQHASRMTSTGGGLGGQDGVIPPPMLYIGPDGLSTSTPPVACNLWRR